MRIGDFEIISTLGAGASGVVYKATNLTTKRVVALKELHTDSEEMKKRAIEEGRAMASVASPHLVTIYNLHEIADRMYLESELVEGANLSSLIASEGLAAEGAEQLLRELLQGLQSMHGIGLIHGDIKPDNVMLRSTGTAVIIDLGLASRGVATAMGGTSQFMAPEMFRPPHHRDAKTDLYSVGMTLYEAVVGRAGMVELFPDILSGRGAALDHHWQSWALDQSTIAVPVDRIRPDIPEALAQLIADLMAKDPANRPASAAAALARMGPSRRPRGAATPPARETSSPDRVTEISVPAAESRPRRPLRTVGFAALALVVAGLGILMYLRRPKTIRIETVPPGASLAAAGKALGKITPTTVTFRGRVQLTASRPGYKEASIQVSSSGENGPVRLEPSCLEADTAAPRLRILVGDGFPVKTLEGSANQFQFVGNGCDHDLEADGKDSTITFGFPGVPALPTEEWPLEKATAEAVQARLNSLAMAWELGVAWDSPEPQLLLLHKSGQPPARIGTYACCQTPPPAVEVNRDVVAFSIADAFPPGSAGPGDESYLAFLEIGPEGDVTLHANAPARQVQRVPANKSTWLTVQPPRTPMQFFVALVFPSAPSFLPRFEATDNEPFRLLKAAEVEKLRNASREQGGSWGRRFSVFEVK